MGDGRSVRRWKDVWLPDIGPLTNQIPSHVNLGMDCILRDMVTDEGLWNLALFRVLLSNDIIKHICLYNAWGEILESKGSILEIGVEVFGSSENSNICRHNLKDIIHAIKDYLAAKRIRLYYDGAIKVNSGEAVAGGVVKDSYGHWILGFNRRLELCSVFNAELWGTLDGLIVIHNKRWEKVSIRIDSLEVIQAIKEAFSRPSYLAVIRYIQPILVRMMQ
ncbi:hypothetical protein Gohar_003824 [Gossypium harknessii]|uniref:RNase H type-1 domain-containing protein n=1 Tax=Gossypium harknessii TaxID=34285 RepID=A0A7J9IAW0_9ROSI|nr:hypothetical protein [Gossypium harknessii]